MKKILFIGLLFVSFVSHAHEYFFAFAEVEYDELNARVEATITVTTHDFERYLQERFLLKDDLNDSKGDTLFLQKLEKELNDHFFWNLNPQVENSILDGVEAFNFKLDGYEIQLIGTVQFYLSADLKQPLSHFEIKFDLLMDEYPEQQNKLTFIHRKSKRTYVFLHSKRTQIIDLY